MADKYIESAAIFHPVAAAPRRRNGDGSGNSYYGTMVGAAVAYCIRTSLSAVGKRRTDGSSELPTVAWERRAGTVNLREIISIFKLLLQAYVRTNTHTHPLAQRRANKPRHTRTRGHLVNNNSNTVYLQCSAIYFYIALLFR